MDSSNSTSFFSRSWTLYDLITEHNYMFHREIYSSITKLLKLRNDPNQYRMLDLGCGNARFLVPALIHSPPAYYQGVDLSEAALKEAQTYLADLSCPFELAHGDMLEAAENTDSQWNVIFTGFAVHHLMPDEKLRFFQAAGRCLSVNGWLLMVDVVREENQRREDYLGDYLRFMRECWIEIPRDELEAACSHVETHDYPESFSTLDEMAKSSGLSNSRVINRYGPHCTILFSRNAYPA